MYYQWQGPFVVVQCFSDYVYRIQKDKKSHLLKKNHDKLKPAQTREPINTDWVKRYVLPSRSKTLMEGNSAVRPKRKKNHGNVLVSGISVNVRLQYCTYKYGVS